MRRPSGRAGGSAGLQVLPSERRQRYSPCFSSHCRMSAATCRLFLSIISMCELPRMPAYRIVLQQAPVDFRWCRSSNKARGMSGGGSLPTNTISCTLTALRVRLSPGLVYDIGSLVDLALHG